MQEKVQQRSIMCVCVEVQMNAISPSHPTPQEMSATQHPPREHVNMNVNSPPHATPPHRPHNMQYVHDYTFTRSVFDLVAEIIAYPNIVTMRSKPIIVLVSITWMMVDDSLVCNGSVHIILYKRKSPTNMGVSTYGGSPKWMVYSGKSY